MGACVSAPRGTEDDTDNPSKIDQASEFEPSTNPHGSSQRSDPQPTYVNGGYWASWKAYDGILPSSLDPTIITQLFYAFASIDGDGTIFLKDEHIHYQVDIDGTNGCLRACTQRKRQNPSLKIILSIGGGDGSSAAHFADVAGHRQKVQRFLESAKILVDKFQLDGIDVDWEYPSSRQQGRQYLELMKKLREVLPISSGYLVTTALPSHPSMLKDIPLSELATIVDQLNLMAYDMVGPTYANVSLTGHHAQLFRRPNSTQPASGAGAVEYLIQHGFPAHRIILGVPAYGHSFAAAEGLYQPFEKAGTYDEVSVRELSFPGMEETYDSDAVAVFATGNGEFITYDNKVSVGAKAKYVKEMGLGGLFFWHLAADRDCEESLVRAGFATLMQ